MPVLRSLLFVPGHKADWIDKALASVADGIIIDLEDSVPNSAKPLARANARTALLTRTHNKTVLIRPNGLATPHHWLDLEATCVNGLESYLLPMLTGRDDVVRFDALITAAEDINDLRRGSVTVVPSFETAAAISAVDGVVSAPRVVGVMAAAARNADVARSVGFRWTAEGTETLYLRSKIVLAARAAGLRTIVLGLWQDVADLDGLRRFAAANADLGFTGQVLIHPTHAPVANDEYGLSDDRAAYYRRLVAAFTEGQRAGNGAVSFEGEHIDLAHAEHAREILRLAGYDEHQDIKETT